MQWGGGCQRFILLFVCLLLIVSACPRASASDGLIMTQQELLSAINDARDGDILLVGDIDFTAPMGIFNELMRVELDKSITIRSGKSDSKAVFKNGSFLLRGSKMAGGGISCSFENILFDGAVDTVSLTASDWERPYDELQQYYTCDVPLKAQYAVSFAGNVNASFVGCVFQNYMYEYGGAIWCRYRDYTDNPYYLDLYGDYSGCKLDVTLHDCQFISNAAHYAGGAVYLDGNRDNVTFRANGCTFINNYSALSDFAGGGGAIYAQYATVELTGCSLIGNQGNYDWGFTIVDGDRSRGGAIHVSNGALDLTDCVIADNVASVGGGLCLTNTPTVIDGCVFTGNRAANAAPADLTGPWASVGIGGAMYVETEGAIPVTVYNSSIYRNSAANAYGGIYGFYNEDYSGVLSHGYGRFDFYFCTVAENICDTDYDYSDPKSILWYSHPGDVWSVPYVTATGCVIIEDSYADAFPRQETPSAENKYNCFGYDGVSFGSTGQYAHLTSDVWEIPSDYAETVLKGRYGDKLTRFYAGSNYDVSLYRETLPESELPQPSAPQESPVPPADKPASRKVSILWLAIPAVAALALVLFLLLKKRKATAEEVPVQEETAPEPKIVMTRYTAAQITQIIQTIPETQLLTTRELEVFQELLMGRKQSEIAYELGISVPTVKDNARRIYDKMDVQNKNELFVKVHSLLQK